MRKRFPFPEPDDGRCRLLQDQGKKWKVHQPLFDKLAAACFADVKQQDVQPTVWARACDAMEPRYGQAFAGEALKLIAAMGRLKGEGCVGPSKEEAKKSGLVLTCDNRAGYSACLTELAPDGKKYCRADVPVVFAPGRGGARAVERGAGRMAPGFVDVEAEALVAAGRVQARGGQAVAQAMAGFGPGWSGGAQLFWAGGAVGATLDLIVDVPQAATWSVEVLLTQAPDYGQLQAAVDGNRATARFDGYSPRVSGPVAVTLGTFALPPGPHRVSLMIVGRNRASTGFLAGVDRVRLQRSGMR